MGEKLRQGNFYIALSLAVCGEKKNELEIVD